VSQKRRNRRLLLQAQGHNGNGLPVDVGEAASSSCQRADPPPVGRAQPPPESIVHANVPVARDQRDGRGGCGPRARPFCDAQRPLGTASFVQKRPSCLDEAQTGGSLQGSSSASCSASCASSAEASAWPLQRGLLGRHDLLQASQASWACWNAVEYLLDIDDLSSGEAVASSIDDGEDDGMFGHADDCGRAFRGVEWHCDRCDFAHNVGAVCACCDAANPELWTAESDDDEEAGAADGRRDCSDAVMLARALEKIKLEELKDALRAQRRDWTARRG